MLLRMGRPRRGRAVLSPVSSIFLISLYHVFLCVLLAMIHIRSMRDRIISRLHCRGREIRGLVHSKAIK